MTDLKDVIWSQASFDDLKKYCHKNNDFLREAAALLQERAKLELIYSDGLQKIASKARKICMDTLGTLRSSWDEFCLQIDLEANIYKTRSTNLLDEISKPLKTFADEQKEARKPAEQAVEKAVKSLAEKRTKEKEAKKSSFNKAKEMENLTVQLESARGKTLSEKELSKLDGKCKKAEESVIKSDNDYITKILDAERARLELESSITSATIVFQDLEVERVKYFKKIFQTYVSLLINSIPQVDQCFKCIENSANSMNEKSDIQVLIETRRSVRLPSEQHVFSCYEEDMGNVMDDTRRKIALESKLNKLQVALQGERKAQKGLIRLNSVYQDTPSFSTKNVQQSLGYHLNHANSVMNLLEVSIYRLQVPLSKLTTGRPVDHRLAKYVNERKDKQGCIHCTLCIPVGDENNSLNTNENAENEPDYLTSIQTSLEQYRKTGNNGNDQDDSDFDPDFEDEVDDSAPPEYAAIDMCKVDYDYTAVERDELTIRPGDIITVILRHDDGWWKGELRGKVGFFPSSYVHELK